MDWEAIFNWLEQKSGVSYDLNDDLSAIGGDTAIENLTLPLSKGRDEV